MVDVFGAVSTQAVLSVDNHPWPKLEIGEDTNRTGVYTLKFYVKNFGNTPLTYFIEPGVSPHQAMNGLTKAIEQPMLQPA